MKTPTPRAPRALPFPRRNLLDILTEMHDCGYCEMPEQRDENLIVCNAHFSYSSLARQCSKSNNGTWHSNSSGMRVQMGCNSVYVINTQRRDDLFCARATVRELTGKTANYSFGSCARTLLQWAMLPSKRTERDLTIQDGGFIGYRECTPTLAYWGVLFDAASCYYQLIRRLDSPRCGINRAGKLEFHPLKTDERARWNDALSAVVEQKILRNSLWGCMHGSATGRKHYFHGEVRQGGAYEGTHYAAAALVARSAWELTQRAAIETNAVYAHTDGIITCDGSVPHVWDDYGIAYRVKRRGKTDVQHLDSWCVGGGATKWYQSRPRIVVPFARADVPPVQWCDEWLLGGADNLETGKGLFHA